MIWYFVVILLPDYRRTWTSEIRLLLNLYGFGHVWLEQGVGDINIFLHVFKQRLKDCNYQQWHEQLDLQGKLRDYKN